MEIFNIGGLELLLILVIALIALGPERMIKFARQFGDWLRKITKNVLVREVIETTDEIRNYPRKILDEARSQTEDFDPAKQIRLEIDDLRKDMMKQSFHTEKVDDIVINTEETENDNN